MRIMKVDHIGYLCTDIQKSIAKFQALGYRKASAVHSDNQPNYVEQGWGSRYVYICFMENGNTRVELVSPMNEESDVWQTLKRQGEGPYHICYSVRNLDAEIDELKKDGWMLLKRPAVAVAFDGARVAFMFCRGAGVIELVETEDEEG